jgi:hypothetical protein
VLERALITVNHAPLDYRVRKQYTLSVRAIDEGGKFDTATVYVYVRDENSRPRFEKNVYSIRVAENALVGATVEVIGAIDDDDGDNARLVYTLEGAHEYFNVTAEGAICVAKELDRETLAELHMRLVAVDGGEPPLKAAATVDVLITDSELFPCRHVCTLSSQRQCATFPTRQLFPFNK